MTPKPHLLFIMDDRSRLICPAPWYLGETSESLVHGLCPVFLERGLPRRLMTDHGAARREATATLPTRFPLDRVRHGNGRSLEGVAPGSVSKTGAAPQDDIAVVARKLIADDCVVAGLPPAHSPQTNSQEDDE